jgi:hypothetical protein
MGEGEGEGYQKNPLPFGERVRVRGSSFFYSSPLGGEDKGEGLHLLKEAILRL